MTPTALRRQLPALTAALALSCASAASLRAAQEQASPGAWYEQPTRLTMPVTSTPPRADGVLAPGEWDVAAAFCGFYAYATGEIMDDGPTLFLACDGEALHALFLVPQAADRELLARVTERDGQVFTDDSVEIYLQTPAQDVFQIVVNSRGTVADYRNGKIGWNATCTAATGQAQGQDLPEGWGQAGRRVWFLELRLPWATLDLPPGVPTEPLRLNAAVNRPTPWAVLAPSQGGSYAAPERFCTLTALAPGSPWAQLLSLGQPRLGDLDLRLLLLNPGPLPVTLVAELDLRTQGGTAGQGAGKPQVQPCTVPSAGRAEVHLRQRVADPAVDRLAYRVTGGEAPQALTLCLRAGPLKVAPPLVLKAGNVPSGKYVVLELDASALRGRIQAEAVDAAVEVLNPAGDVVTSQSARVPLGRSDLRVAYGALPVATYTCRVVLRAGATVAASAEASFRHAPPPAWLSSTLYDECAAPDRVPLPWTPVSCGAQQVAVWGRTLAWRADSLLPASIRSQDADLLAGPIQVVVTRAGREMVVPLDSFQFAGQTPTRASFTARGAVAGLQFTADMWIEYDGLLWVTLSGLDGPAAAPPEALRVVVRLDPSRTTLYQTFSRRLTGWLGTEPIPFSWVVDPTATTVNFYHWFGNERGGLGFTYTTLEHWLPASNERFCEVRPGQDAVVYTMNLQEAPATLGGRTFVFGLQATPIKPLPPDYHAMLAATAQFEPWKAWQQIPEAIDMVLTWPTPTGNAMVGLQDPYHVRAEVLTDLASRVHERGVAFVGVASCPQKISALDEWFADYRLEWQALPESTLAWDNVPHLQDCGRSRSLRQWLFHGWAVENVRRFGLDGIYFDGWQAGTMGCANPHHGCGWTDAAGQRQLTVPVLEGREFNQRLLRFLEDNVHSPYVPPASGAPRPGFPRYHYWIHSWEFVPSVMGFATAWLTGEFAGYPLSGPSLLTPEGTYGKCLGLGLFRSRALSSNWGVPNLFDTLMWEHTENHPTDRQTRMAYAWFLPHGVPAGLIEYANQKTIVEVSQALLAFGTRRARFTPCWEPNPYLTVEAPLPREVMVATWDRAAPLRVLGVVSNLNVAERRVIGLAWTGFEHPRIVDALTRQPLALDGRRLQVALEPESFVLLAVEP